MCGARSPHDSPERFRAWGVEVIRGTATLARRHAVRVDGRILTAPRLVVATGSAPAVPAIPGLPSVPFLTNETVFGLEELPEHLVVLGGGAVGVELAQAFRRLGAAVTLLEAKAVLGGSDREAARLVTDALEADGVRVSQGVAPTRVEAVAGGVRVQVGEQSVTGSHLLVAAGRVAQLEGLGLAAAGVRHGPDGILVDARRRTSNRDIFAIGDCRAGPRLTHAAGEDGGLVVAALGFGLPSRVRPLLLPSAVHTAPALAQIGRTETETEDRAGAGRVRVTRATFAEDDRAVAEGETPGFVKTVWVGRRLAGVTIVGEGAAELLLPWSLAMAGKASAWRLATAVVAYPTRSEASKAAAFAGFEGTLFGAAARAWARALAWLRGVTTGDKAR